MTPKIFATGVTGYLGGSVLHTILAAHPTWAPSVTCLIRTSSRGTTLTTTYPTINTVTGTLEDSELLEEEASKADIILHFASSDHVGAATAIKRGLERGKGGYWIHTSGTDVLLNPKVFEGVFQENGDGEVKVYDDWDGIDELLAFSDAHSHRPCDRIVLSLSDSSSPISSKIKTAIICPPTIWGPGRGTGSTRSHQIYELTRLILTHGSRALHLITDDTSESSPSAAAATRTFWPNIHVDDLSRLYLNVFESAVSELDAGGDQETSKSKATWNSTGYYFAENGVHHWQDVEEWVIEEAVRQGYISSSLTSEDGVRRSESEKPDLTKEELTKAAGFALFNSETSCRSLRAKKLFGWEPEQGGLRGEMARIVRTEAERAGLHARF